MGDDEGRAADASADDDVRANIDDDDDDHRTVFVTVGTTEFDALIRRIRSPPILAQLRSRGYRRVVFQIGRGAFEPTTSTDADGAAGSGVEEGVEINWFRLKPSIAADMRDADLVISHAGAGSILEALEARKLLLVVVNDSLMDNHQTELASKMRQLGHCFCATVDTLEGAIAMLDSGALTPYPPATPRRFGALVDRLVAS